MTRFAQMTGDTPITVDPDCVATGGSPTQPSSCTTQQVAGDHLVTILENGNTANANGQYDSNVETALDIEQAHGIATHAAMKYYDADCSDAVAPGSGNSDSGNCNGSDVGLEDAVEDAANDPTLHTVSNSWGYGGDPSGARTTRSSRRPEQLRHRRRARHDVLLLHRRLRHLLLRLPGRQPVRRVRRRHDAVLDGLAHVLSTEQTWTAAGSFCSNIIDRPAWQTGTGVAANAPCPGRAAPDVSAVADTQSAVRVVATADNNGGTLQGASAVRPSPRRS